MPDLSVRSYEAEMMDQPTLDADAIRTNFDDLVFINRWLGGGQHSVSAIRDLVGSSPIEVIADIGSGAGDLIMQMRTYRLANQFLAIDPMREAQEYLSQRYGDQDDIEQVSSTFEDWFDQGHRPDVVHASLFCHHLDDDTLVAFLKQAKAAAQYGVVINDLHRHSLAYHSIRILTRWFAKSSYTKHDAPLSVLRGFRRAEWESILQKAGITDYTIKWRWAFRHVITIPA